MKQLPNLKRSSNLTPDNADGYYNLAKALKAKEKKPEAEAAYRKAKQLNPQIKPL